LDTIIALSYLLYLLTVCTVCFCATVILDCTWST